MSAVELVIFDCDGVLVDSEFIACQSVATCLKDADLDMPLKDVIESYTGVSVNTMMTDLSARFGERLPSNFAELVQTRTREEFDNNLRAVDGVSQVLEVIPFHICVASSSAPDRIVHSLDITGLLHFFDGNVFSATQVVHGKPAPDLFLFAAQRMSVPVEGCLVIEDSIPGVQAARAAEMLVFGFTGGSHCQPAHADRLSKAGALKTFKTMRELPPLLANLS